MTTVRQRGCGRECPSYPVPSERHKEGRNKRIAGYASAVQRLRRSLSREANILVAALVLFVALSLTAGPFFTLDNLLNIATLVSLWAIVGVGQTFLIISGEIDLSVGSLFGFLVVLMGVLVGPHQTPLVRYASGLQWDLWSSAAAVIGLGMAIGLLNGLITTKVGLPSFIVTLAGWAVWRSGTLVLTDAKTPYVEITSTLFREITGGRLFGVIPWLVVWMVLIAIVGQVVLTGTKFGYHVHATGSNLQAAKNTGIRTDWTKTACFMLTGGLVAVISVLWVGFLSAAPLFTGVGFELQVIAAVVIGGTALTGGKGSVIGTLIGAIVFGMISNGLVLYGMRSAWQQVAVGGVIIAVASTEFLIRRRPRLAASPSSKGH